MGVEDQEFQMKAYIRLIAVILVETYKCDFLAHCAKVQR